MNNYLQLSGLILLCVLLLLTAVFFTHSFPKEKDKGQTIRRIVLPQAFRTAFPTLGNSLISMVKDTSLAANITVTEMFMTTQRIVARTYEPLLLYVEVGLIYLIFCTVLTKLQTSGEKRLQKYGRR